ncbi:beta strand repeat-containing protein, partial [Aquimarina sp. 2-A2]|uniref:beta strand repeat-containing protein n=1 Tax=Aquimarina sp. 2-A2 TaxID=3382644 RepID=UPI00387EEDAF
MKFKITLLLLIFLNLTAAVAQVKIGDNPNQIDANSLLELESSNKVLVLSRVNTTQMNAIAPLNGALVYNTDQDCVYQYTGSTWESLCSIIETTTLLLDNNDGTFSYTNEAGTTVNINKAFLTNNGDGTFTFDNGNGSPINFVGTDNQTAAQVAFDDTASTLGATNVQGAIDALAASNAADGDTSDTNETNIAFAVNGTNLEITDSAGTLQVPLAAIDNQNATEVNLNTPIDVDGDTVNELTVEEAIADLAASSSDNQTAAEVSFDDTASTLGATDVQGAIDALAATSSDDQNLTGATLTGTSLQIDIEGGTSTTVDLAGLQDGTGTDNQTAAQVAFTPTGNTTSTDVQAAIEEIQTEVDGFAAVAGEDNNAVNVGLGGVGTFKQKNGVDLEFKNINSTSGKITVTDDIVNDEIDLEISANAITTNELADNAVTNTKLAANAVTTDKILDGTIASADIAADAVNAATINGDVAGTGLVQNITTGALEVDPTAFNGDGNITSGDLTVGGDANALLGDVTLEIAAGAVGNTELAANAVTTDKILDGTIASADIAADAVNAATINGDVAGTGLVQNITTGALEVDPTAFNGDGNITSGDLTVGGDANALLGDVTLEIAAGAVGNTELAANAVTTDKILDGTIASADIAADAVNAATINGDVAGTGLVQNITTGALEVDPTAFNGDGNITSGDLTVGGDANALLGDVTLEIAAGAVGTAELADGAVTNIKLAANAVTTDKILDGTIASADIAADAVNAATINGDVAGTGLVQNITTGALEVDPTAFNGDGNITSGDLTVGGDVNALLGDVTLEIAAGAVGNAEIAANAVTTDKILDGTIASADIAADAVNAATINGDVAGTGLVQNITTGALEVDPTAFNG